MLRKGFFSTLVKNLIRDIMSTCDQNYVKSNLLEENFNRK